MRQLALLGALLPLALAACGDQSTPKADQKASASSAPKAAPPTPAPAAPASAGKLARKADGLDFSYRWPAEAAAIPPLDSWLRGNGAKLLGEAQKEALTDRTAARRDGFPFHEHSYEEAFAVVADTPATLVLLSEGYVYTGGAHGMPIATALIWDRAAGRRLATGQMIDLPRFARLARDRYCDELDRQRAEKRGAPVKRDDPNEIAGFAECVDMQKQLVLPMSRKGTALDTIRVVIGPYEAGPYAEGSYVIDLPLDAGLLATVKPAYRTAFGVQ